VIEALLANRLTSPAPLVRVTGWAGEHAVEEVFAPKFGHPKDAAPT